MVNGTYSMLRVRVRKFTQWNIWFYTFTHKLMLSAKLSACKYRNIGISM